MQIGPAPVPDAGGEFAPEMCRVDCTVKAWVRCNNVKVSRTGFFYLTGTTNRLNAVIGIGDVGVKTFTLTKEYRCDSVPSPLDADFKPYGTWPNINNPDIKAYGAAEKCGDTMRVMMAPAELGKRNKAIADLEITEHGCVSQPVSNNVVPNE